MPRPTPAPETKVCAVCGREYERPRYRNGMLQNPKAWEIRQTCGPKCGQRLGGRIALKVQYLPGDVGSAELGR